MKSKLEQLVRKAHEWFGFMTKYYTQQGEYNIELINEGMKISSPFEPSFMEKVRKRDIDIEVMPDKIAEELLKEELKEEDIQGMIDSLDQFNRYSPETFSKFGSFLSVMMRRVFRSVPELHLKTPTYQVHVPNFYQSAGRTEEDSYPWHGLEAMREYNRNYLLIGNLCKNLTRGMTVFIEGNVGSFFANGNLGAYIQLDGECGWRGCYGHRGGETVINGTAGHELCTSASGGKISITGNLRSVGDYYTTAYQHEIYLNENLLPKKGVGPPSNIHRFN